MAGITGWIALWWILEAIPLPVTALLPVVLFPVFGIMSTKAVAPLYMNHVMFLFIGGFMVAFAMERWNLHKRIALKIILAIGNDLNRVLLGMMVASYLLSMWISNTATTMMMIPTTLAVVGKLRDSFQDGKQAKTIATGMLLAIAYAASIGGTATLVGTPPNLIFMSHYNEIFPETNGISFLEWFMMGLPISFLLLGFTYFVLKKMYLPKANSQPKANHRHIFEREYQKLGKISFEEKVVSTVFILLAVLWFTRADLNLGATTIRGWSSLFEQPGFMTDGTVAVFCSVFLFLIPSKQQKGGMILKWEDVKKLPYGIILLFGGGFALAKGFVESGLTEWLGNHLALVGTLPLILVVAAICTFMTFVTEITSNMATTQLMMPILAAIAISTGLSPELLMIAATFSASCAFMLPVATAPNMIVFGSEKIQISEMVRTGIILNLIGIVVIAAVMLLWGKWVLGV